MRWTWVVMAVLGLASIAWPRPDLKQALAESNLEKRSGLALENAANALEAARKAYQNGDLKSVQADADEILESVDLAYTSLRQTGKNPRKSPKWFKRAEIETRNLGRKLDAFREEMSYADRPMLDKVRARVQKVHDNLLLGLMEGKRQ